MLGFPLSSRTKGRDLISKFLNFFISKLKTFNDILDLIPQRPPVVMVDSFLGVEKTAEGEVAHSSFTVPNNHIFLRPDHTLDECALIENMAQSAALRAGWLCREQGLEVPVGYIGAVGKCNIARPAHAGEVLQTTVRVVAEVGDVTMAEAEIRVDNKPICGCTLKIFLQQKTSDNQ
jgi:3-hydroxymyristoyl/3-hydroxydecanoyl-(acyl carrier protein) dehydratase